MKKNNSIFFISTIITLIVSIMISSSFIVNDNFLNKIKIKNNDILINDKSSEVVENNEIVFNIDNFNCDNNIIMRGWAIIKGHKSKDNIYILFKGEKNQYVISNGENRNDVTKHINDGVNYNKSGFNVYASKHDLEKDRYEVCILIRDRDKYNLIKTDKIIETNYMKSNLF